MWAVREGETVTLTLRIQPGAGKNEISGLLGDALKIRIQARPVEGEANKELVKFLAKTFRVPKGEVEILSGETGRNKRVRLPASENLLRFLDSFGTDASQGV